MGGVVSKGFKRLILWCIISTLGIVLAGGIVRATGSGMGCPDWPRCFGRLIPPTSVNQLPADYKEHYVQGRILKNQRFAKLLVILGKADLANYILHDQSILQPETFNVSKTYTEYVNRLVGMITFYLCLALLIWSFKYRKISWALPIYALATLIFLGANAVLGAVVVSTNLTQWVITVHMLLTLVVLGFLLLLYSRVNRDVTAGKTLIADKPNMTGGIKWVKIVAALATVLTVAQIVIGTELREAIDMIMKGGGQRQYWQMAIKSNIFNIHRDFALILTAVNILLLAKLWLPGNSVFLQHHIVKAIGVIIALQVASGIVLSYFALPAAVQPLHLLLSMVLFCYQFYLMLRLRQKGNFI